MAAAALSHLTMNYPHCDSHIRCYNQQNNVSSGILKLHGVNSIAVLLK